MREKGERVSVLSEWRKGGGTVGKQTLFANSRIFKKSTFSEIPKVKLEYIEREPGAYPKI